MKYNLFINQKSIIDNGFDLDLYEAIILDFIVDFSCSKRVEKIHKNGSSYCWISYNMVINELPILKIKKDTIYRKIKSLCDKGFLKHLEEGPGMTKAFYEVTEKAEMLRYGLKSEGTDMYPKRYGRTSERGTDVHPYNNNTNNNNINNKDEFHSNFSSNDEKEYFELIRKGK